jgi:hypothetical protein
LILFGKFLQTNPAFAWVCLGIGVALFVMLSKRYLDMRTFWVKHTYRAFLALLATDKQKLDLTDSGELRCPKKLPSRFKGKSAP